MLPIFNTFWRLKKTKNSYDFLDNYFGFDKLFIKILFKCVY